MSDRVDIDDEFVAKWRVRWPEWRVGLGFVPADARVRTAAWFALLDEIGDAAWGGADATPGLAKLAWWQEELQGWAKGARRHPLAADLQRVDAPWQTLALALRLLPATRDPANAPSADLAALGDLARAVDACEARLFATGAPIRVEAGASAATLLAAKAMLHADSRLAGACLDAWPARAGTRPRRIANAIFASRLRTLQKTGVVRPVAGPTLLWTVWRAARG